MNSCCLLCGLSYYEVTKILRADILKRPRSGGPIPGGDSSKWVNNVMQTNFIYRSRLWAIIWAFILAIYLSLPFMRALLGFLKDTVGRGNVGLVLNGALLVCGCMLLSMGLRRSWKALLQVSIPIAIMAAVAYQLHIPEERVHFLEYGLLGILVQKTARQSTWVQFGMASLFVVLVGVGDECIQWWLPTRVGDFRDVGMNALAGVLGVWMGKVLFWTPSST